MELNRSERNIIREWFDAIQDTNPKYLDILDYRLAARIYHESGMRLPNSIKTPLEEAHSERE